MNIETPIPGFTSKELEHVHTVVIKPEDVIFSFFRKTGAPHNEYYNRYRQCIHQWLENWLGSESLADAKMNDVEDGPITEKSWGTILSESYHVDRVEVEDFIWNISPEGAVVRNQSPVNAIWKLQEMGKRVVLFSHFNRTWMNNILQHLQLTKEFELRCTGDAYPNPADALRGLYYGIDLSRTVFVSSYKDTDFISAYNAGMHVFHHNTRYALIRLVNGT
jgi:hypothetical protein